VSDIRACLRSALNSAIRKDLITKNPAAMVVLPTARKKKRASWSSQEAHQFLEAAWWERDPMYAAYVLVLVLGLRKGEVLGLCWSDVDFDGGELGIGLQLQRARRKLLHRQTKSEASDDTLPLVDIVETALRHRQKEQRADREKAGDAWQESDLVFTTALGTPIDPRNFNRSWSARHARSEVRKITVHDGRRTCATLLVDLEVHPLHVMRILRHAQFSVTMEIYAQASSKKTREALKRLGESLDR
jgi:integrase